MGGPDELEGVSDQLQGGIDRRGLLKKGAIVAGLAGVAAAAAPAIAHAGDGEKYFIDMACLGDTFFVIPADPARVGNGDFRGSTFSVEGAIYKRGTIDGNGFDPAKNTSKRIGTWMCRGWILINPARPSPHVISTQEYVLGTITGSRHFVKDTLSSSGLEGSDAGQTGIRAVTGGTGRFDGVRGTVLQDFLGTNTTILNGLNAPAPSYRFEFRFK